MSLQLKATDRVALRLGMTASRPAGEYSVPRWCVDVPFSMNPGGICETLVEPIGVIGIQAGQPGFVAAPTAAAPVKGAVPMSLSLRVARAGLPGIQPSILGGIGKFLGGVIKRFPGPVGIIGGALGGVFGGRAGQKPPVGRPGVGFQDPFQKAGPILRRTPTPGIAGAGQRLIPGGATGFETTVIGCPAGFHPNKTSYFLQSGELVEEGSRCVRNRRVNPMNPRALSRSIRRVESAKRVSKRLARITIRKKC